MAIVLTFPLAIPEIRVLQEFRRVGVESLPLESLRSIKHPAGGGEAPIQALISAGYLTRDDSAETFTLTDKARALLARESVPEGEASGASDQAAG